MAPTLAWGNYNGGWVNALNSHISAIFEPNLMKFGISGDTSKVQNVLPPEKFGGPKIRLI